MPSALLGRKSLDLLRTEAGDTEHGLKRVLGPFHLISLGIGAIIGAGIFVFTGSAAANYAGPALVLSFVVAGIGSALAGLCYAEFAALIPIAGSAYTYGYATLGEIFAWIIGWDLVLEYAFGAAGVAVGWAGNVNIFLQDIGLNLPPRWVASPGTQLVFYKSRWELYDSVKGLLQAQKLSPEQITAILGHMPTVSATFNLLAFLGIVAVTTILVIGIQESATLNSIVVMIKVGVVLVFIGLASSYVLGHHEQAAANWTPFIPPNLGEFGKFGISGIFRGAGVIFFAYIGFDAVSTAAQEAKNPQRDMPIGILGSLAICTVLYILVSGLLTAVVPYRALNDPAPVAVGTRMMGVAWGSYLVEIGSIAGLGSVMLVMLLGQSRVFFSMSRDGLLPEWAGRIHPRFKTPYISSITVGIFVAIFAGSVPISVLGELVSIGTLLAFVIVCGGVLVLRYRSPDMPRPFKTPFVPAVPILGILVSLLMMASLPGATWIRLVIWLAIGMVVYFGYSRHHSKLQV